jgi:hypothetical protein
VRTNETIDVERTDNRLFSGIVNRASAGEVYADCVVTDKPLPRPAKQGM